MRTIFQGVVVLIRLALFIAILLMSWWVIDDIKNCGLESGALLFFLLLLTPLAWSSGLWSFITFGLIGSKRR